MGHFLKLYVLGLRFKDTIAGRDFLYEYFFVLTFPDGGVLEVRPVLGGADGESTAEPTLVAELLVSSDTTLVKSSVGSTVSGK